MAIVRITPTVSREIGPIPVRITGQGGADVRAEYHDLMVVPQELCTGIIYFSPQEDNKVRAADMKIVPASECER